MTTRHKSVRPKHSLGSSNVYVDLGFPDADDMLVKAQLVAKISEILGAKGYTQTEAARIVGLPQPKLSKLLRGQFNGFSERKLMDCLVRLGRDIQIIVVDRPRARTAGAVSVRFEAA
jgi:predicted XRE-type DNA-binding protein